MAVLGLTGSIGAGKSTVMRQFASLGAAVLDCDRVVHDLYENEALSQVAEHFPEAQVEGKIHRGKLAEHIFSNPERKARLEAIIHPLVQAKARAFREANAGKVVVFEIQLLFEAKANENPAYGITHTLMVDAPREQRLARALRSRPQLTPERFAQIDSSQMPPEEKRKRADFIIHNEDGADTLAQVRQILARIGA